jgi:hypothetical protein
VVPPLQRPLTEKPLFNIIRSPLNLDAFFLSFLRTYKGWYREATPIDNIWPLHPMLVSVAIHSVICFASFLNMFFYYFTSLGSFYTVNSEKIKYDLHMQLKSCLNNE